MGDQISLKALSPRRRLVRDKIVYFHNYFRSKVQPIASNMLKMVSEYIFLEILQYSKSISSLLHSEMYLPMARHGVCQGHFKLTRFKYLKELRSRWFGENFTQNT